MDDESMLCNPQANTLSPPPQRSICFLGRLGRERKCADEREAKPLGLQAPDAKDFSTY